MECIFYQYQAKSQVQCAECYKKRTNDPEKSINCLFFGNRNGEKVGRKNSFRSWHDKNSSHITLTYKYTPPKKSDIIDSLPTRSVFMSSSGQNERFKEFSPVYSKKPTDTTVNKPESLKNNVEKINPASSSLSAVNSNEKGSWCAGTSEKKNKLPQTKPICKEILKIKEQYCVSDHQRGAWIIKDGCSNSNKMSGIWREICKMLKCGRLPNCNAKYQREKQEIWLYCDVIDSLIVQQKLKDNTKLGMINTPISYRIHPHGYVIKI